MKALGRVGQWFYQTSDADLGLAKGERIVKDSFGCLMGRFIGVQGRLVLTNRRLIFLSQSPRLVGAGQVRLDVELRIVQDAATGSVWEWKAAFSPFLPFSVIAGGETYQYQSVDASELVALIKTTLPTQ